MPVFGRKPGVARRASNFLLLRQKKVTKEKATPSLRPLRCAKGQTCGVSVAGCAVELTALRCSFVQTSTASQFTKHARSDARATPQPPRRRRSQQGWDSRTANIHSGHRCARPRLRSAWRLRPRDGAERSAAKQWPAWMSLGFPSGCAWGAQGAGWHARRSARASCSSSPWLSERRAQRKASSTAHPVTEHPRLPRSAAKGSQTVGSPFLW